MVTMEDPYKEEDYCPKIILPPPFQSSEDCPLPPKQRKRRLHVSAVVIRDHEASCSVALLVAVNSRANLTIVIVLQCSQSLRSLS